MKKVLLLVLQSLFGLTLLLIFLKTNDLSKFPSYFSNISIPGVLIVAFVYLFASILRIIRFKILLAPLKKISYWDSTTISWAGALLNYLLPIRAGEIGRAFFIKKKYNLSLASGTTVSFVDKTFDFLAVLVVFVIFVPLIGNYSVFNLISYTQIILILLVFFILYFLVFREKLCFDLVAKLVNFLPTVLSKRLLSLFKKALSGFSVLRLKPFEFFFLLLLSFLSLVIDGAYFYFLFPLLGFQTSLPLIILGYSFFNLSFIIPGGPGYVGNIELLGVLIFSTFLGISKEHISSVIIFHHLLLTLILAIPGAISLMLLNQAFLTRSNLGFLMLLLKKKDGKGHC